jgi:ketopantoate reductase
MRGSGALGSAVGDVLTEGGNDVWLIDARASHVDAMHGHYEPGLYPVNGDYRNIVRLPLFRL